MNVLVLHSRYLSGTASGENRVVEDEVHLLREAGHRVVLWQPSVEPQSSGFRIAADAVWSRAATRHVADLVEAHSPKIVHVHSVFPRLSPAVLRGVPADVPIVMTLHNFRMMCLPATYVRGGAICEECAGKLPWRGVLHACYRDSRAASSAMALSLALHRAVGSFARVARYLAVSNFVREKHIAAGLDPALIRVKENFTWPAEPRQGPGGPLLFVGRIAPEKGLETVLRALPVHSELVVVGGERGRSALHGLSNRRVHYVGQVDVADVGVYLRRARALIVPSRWYEGQPRVIVEAFAAGVPVIASRIGGLPELVVDGGNGLLVDPWDVDAWRASIERISDDDLSARLGNAARTTWERRFTPEVALRALEYAYCEALEPREG